MKQAVLGLVACLCAASAMADIYKCTDDSGHVTYANAGGKGCRKLSIDRVTNVPPPPATSSSAAPARSASGGDFPRVGGDEQRARDNDRRRILEAELNTEQSALDKARAALVEQEGIRLGDERNYQRVLDRLKPYQDQVALHERNIEALRKELGNLR